MFKDPIVEEVRAARQKHAAQFNYDLRKIAADLKMKEQQAGRKMVSFPSKPAKDKAVACLPSEQSAGTDGADTCSFQLNRT